jgi:lysozyme
MRVKEFIKGHEGLRLIPYKCSLGFWTGGWGHNFDAHNEPVPKSLTKQQADVYFDNDFIIAAHAARAIVSSFGYLNEAGKAVLISMAFQMGAARFRTFRNTIAFINAGKYNQAAHEMLRSTWAKQTPERAANHAIIFATGLWPEED